MKEKESSCIDCEISQEPSPELRMEHGGISRIRIGMVGNYPDSNETRMLLTPEACGLLTSAGIEVSMETNAGVDISYTDESYAEYGVNIVSRHEALQAQIVLSFMPLQPKDLKKMQKGATLLCMMGHTLFEESTIQTLLDRQINCGCFDNMYSHHELTIFANIIDEIDGHAAMMYAQDSLSYLGGGSGILLGSVAGLNPCEVLIIGNGTAAVTAANSAAARGARAVLMDNDISALELSRPLCAPGVELIAIHPRVLANRVKSADVIMLGNPTRDFTFPKALSGTLKDNVYILDFNETHPSVSVPRTVAMALSNPLINFFNEMNIKNGFDGMVATTPGVQAGMVTYHGKLVDKLIAGYTGHSSIDIRVMLSASN